MKTQIIINKENRKILTVDSTSGSVHDFSLYKTTNYSIPNEVQVMADSGYQGISNINKNSIIPIKKKKNQPLCYEDKLFNTRLSRIRVACENVFGMLKRFKIISERFRNIRGSFESTFSLIAKLYNYEIAIR